MEEKPLVLASPTRTAATVEAAVAQGGLDGGTFEPARLDDDGIPVVRHRRPEVAATAKLAGVEL